MKKITHITPVAAGDWYAIYHVDELPYYELVPVAAWVVTIDEEGYQYVQPVTPFIFEPFPEFNVDNIAGQIAGTELAEWRERIANEAWEAYQTRNRKAG